MTVQTLRLKPAVNVAAVLRVIQQPLRIPAWAIVTLGIMAGIYGYVSGRQNPMHHYVPYVGYPLVLDTTTGKACYSSTPKPSDAALVGDGSAADASGLTATGDNPTGPAIPVCGK
jgi:hypothetical protein